MIFSVRKKDMMIKFLHFSKIATPFLIFLILILLSSFFPESVHGQVSTRALLKKMHKPSDQVTAFVNVNVVPMDGNKILHNQTVIVRGDRIFEIGPVKEVQIPQAAKQIKGDGQYLIPGLVDMHFHLPGPKTKKKEIEAYLLFFIAKGVTTVRSTIGAPNHTQIRNQIKSNKFFGPTLYLASPPLSSRDVKTPSQARQLVYQHKTDGYDLIKLYDISDTAVYDAAVQAAQEVKLPFFGHVSPEIGVYRALKAGQSIEHLDGYLKAFQADSNNFKTLVKLTKQSGIWNCPTQFFCEYIYGFDLNKQIAYEGVSYVSKKLLDRWIKIKKEELEKYAGQKEANQKELEARRKIIKKLHEGGAKLLLSGDSPGKFRLPGFCLLHEMRAFAKAGLDPYEILKTGTYNPADYFNALEEFGTVEVGKRADLLLLEANPLEDINNISKQAGVMLRGVWFTSPELDKITRAYAKELE